MEQQPYQQNQKKTLIGIKIISILNYIFAVFGIFFGIMGIIGGITFIFKGELIASEIFGITSPGTLGSLAAGEFGKFNTQFSFIILLMGFIFLVISIFVIILGIKMWKGKNWARVSEIILMVLWIILWSIELFKGNFFNLVMIIPALIIFFYLIFSKSVRQYFS